MSLHRVKPNMHSAVIAAFLAWSSGSVALAQDYRVTGYSGAEMQAKCQTQRAFVEGYVSGWVTKFDTDGTRIATELGTEKAGTPEFRYLEIIMQDICLGGQIDIGEATTAFCGYIASHPQQMKFEAETMLENAMKEMHPCQR
jgi:hypothetical protein